MGAPQQAGICRKLNHVISGAGLVPADSPAVATGFLACAATVRARPVRYGGRKCGDTALRLNGQWAYCCWLRLGKEGMLDGGMLALPRRRFSTAIAAAAAPAAATAAATAASNALVVKQALAQHLPSRLAPRLCDLAAAAAEAVVRHASCVALCCSARQRACWWRLDTHATAPAAHRNIHVAQTWAARGALLSKKPEFHAEQAPPHSPSLWWQATAACASRLDRKSSKLPTSDLHRHGVCCAGMLLLSTRSGSPGGGFLTSRPCCNCSASGTGALHLCRSTAAVCWAAAGAAGSTSCRAQRWACSSCCWRCRPELQSG